MNTTRATRRPNKTLLRSLSLRLAAQNAELATCTTVAMTKCVAESIADTERQLRVARAELAEIAWGRRDLAG